jgi:predicted Zn finger-like uncharacterized protein
MRIICPQCEYSRDVPDENIPPQARWATCPKCGHKFEFRTPEEGPAEDRAGTEESRQAGEESEEDIWATLESLNTERAPEQAPEEVAEEPSRIPWENLQEHGFFAGLFGTIRAVMFDPVRFFTSMPLGLGFHRPLVFYLLLAEIQIVAQLLWRMLGLLPQTDGGSGSLLGLGLAGAGSLLILVLYPVLMTPVLFLSSGLNHLCLRLVGATHGGFEGTFKVISYASAPMILAVVPAVGPLAGVCWSLVCTFLGFRYVHGTTPARVLLAMVLLFAVVSLPLLLFSSAFQA